jgi:hypothetical protein
MKGKISSIFTLLAILILVFISVPLTSTKLVMAQSSSSTVSISVIPTTVAHGSQVLVKVKAKNNEATQQRLVLKTRVFKWTRRFLWFYYWKEMKSWTDGSLLNGQSKSVEHSYTPSVKARYKAEAGLYDDSGRTRKSASVEFRAT